MNTIDMMKLAKAFMAGDKYNKAEVVLQQCLSLDAGLLPAIDLLISVCRRQGKLEETISLQQKLDCRMAQSAAQPDISLMNAASAMGRTGLIPAPFRVVRNPLTQSQVAELLRMAEQCPDQFEPGKVSGEYEVMLERRNSLRLVSQKAREAIASFLYPHVRNEFARCCASFAIPDFDIGNIEYKFCHYPHGSYFRLHRDNRHNYKNKNNEMENFERRISFVYYFHRAPRKFAGGDLLLHDTDRNNDLYSFESYLKVIPENNMLVFFPSGFYHQVTDVVETSGDALNGRFSINGHICAAVPAGLSAAEQSA